jgi:Fungal N-terminal domain of STAND proteins
MAEVIGLSASIIGIAGAGVSVVTALTKFGISYKESNDKINELAARVSLTATILQAIGDTVKENEDAFKREAFMVTWKEVLDFCAGNYAKIQAAISKARRSKSTLTTWYKLKWAVGGEARMKDLEDSLEKSSQQVLMMQQVIQLTAIKLIGKS